MSTPPRLFVTAALAALLLSGVTDVARAETRVGVSLPLSGDFALLGRQALAGARAAAAALGSDITLIEVDDGCSVEGGQVAAARMREARAQVAIGFLCTEPLEAAAEALKAQPIPLITIGVRTNTVTSNRARSGWNVFRLAPSAAQEIAAVGALISERWREVPFAIVDDGTLYARELAEGLRLAAEERGLKPVLTDTFRPQLDNQVALVRRLENAGATHVFVAGDATDAAIIARDAAEDGDGLVVAGGDGFRAAPGDTALAEGTLMVSIPDWAGTPAAAPAAAAIRAAGRQPEGYAIPAYAAVEIAVAAVRESAASGGDVGQAIVADGFQTSLGPVSFDERGDLRDNPFHLFSFDGEAFVPAPERD